MGAGATEAGIPSPRRVVRSEALAQSLASIYGPDLVGNVVAEGKRNSRIAALRFFDWLSRSRTGTPAHMVLTAFREKKAAPLTGEGETGARDGRAGIVAHERAFFDVFMQWCREWLAY